MSNPTETPAQALERIEQAITDAGRKKGKIIREAYQAARAGGHNIVTSVRIALGEHEPTTNNPHVVPDAAVQALRQALASARPVPGKGVLLSMPQLDRKTYQDVNVVLEALGGKWNRKLGGHLFSEDPSEKLATVIETGRVVIPKDEFEFFPTPVPVAKRMASAADLHEGMDVLEPSAGHGALIDAALAQAPNLRVTAMELSPDSVQVLRRKYAGAIEIQPADFLEAPAVALYDRILMNPPFSGGGDVKHVLRAYDEFLAPGGRLVAVVSAGVGFRSDKATKRLRELAAKTGEIVELPKGSFKESGTDVGTMMVVLNKPGEAKPKSRAAKPKSRSQQLVPELLVDRDQLAHALEKLLHHDGPYFVAYEAHTDKGALRWRLLLDWQGARVDWSINVGAEGPREGEPGPSEYMYPMDARGWLERLRELPPGEVRIDLSPGPTPPQGFGPGAWVVVDERHPAVVSTPHLAGCPNYLFPHYHLKMVGGDEENVVKADRVSAGVAGPKPAPAAAPTRPASRTVADLKRYVVPGTHLWWRDDNGTLHRLTVDVAFGSEFRLSGLTPGQLVALRWPKAGGVHGDGFHAPLEGPSSSYPARLSTAEQAMRAMHLMFAPGPQAERPRSAPKPRSARQLPTKGTLEWLINDLVLTADNESQLYSMRQSAERKIKDWLRQGSYDNQAAVHLWRRYLTRAAQMRKDEKGFTPAVIDAAAEQYAADALRDLQYDVAAEAPREHRLDVLDEDAVAKLGRLEGMDWIARQNRDMGKLRDPGAVYANQEAHRQLRHGPDAAALASFQIRDILPGGGFIEGEHGRQYVIRPDGEVMLIEDTASAAFIDKARSILRIA